MEIKYDLTKSPSYMDRRKGQWLIDRGEQPIGTGVILYETETAFGISVPGRTGYIEIPKEALL